MRTEFGHTDARCALSTREKDGRTLLASTCPTGHTATDPASTCPSHGRPDDAPARLPASAFDTAASRPVGAAQLGFCDLRVFDLVGLLVSERLNNAAEALRQLPCLVARPNHSPVFDVAPELAEAHEIVFRTLDLVRAGTQYERRIIVAVEVRQKLATPRVRRVVIREHYHTILGAVGSLLEEFGKTTPLLHPRHHIQPVSGIRYVDRQDVDCGGRGYIRRLVLIGPHGGRGAAILLSNLPDGYVRRYPAASLRFNELPCPALVEPAKFQVCGAASDGRSDHSLRRIRRRDRVHGDVV